MSFYPLIGWLTRLFKNKTITISVITLCICLGLLSVVWIYHINSTPVQKSDSQSTAQAWIVQHPRALANLSVSPTPDGVSRMVQIHTAKPTQASLKITQYTVQKGDTIFGIAEKFGLLPSTILWGNLTKLADNPELIHPAQVLNILPEDGVYYQWQKGDGLHGVASGLGVKPEDIINYPANHLDEKTIGDLSHPNITPGTWLMVPGGHREFIVWSAPAAISRFNPGVAKLFGPGACDKPTDGSVGTGTFTWPTVDHWLSGYDYTLSANHPAVDFGGQMGNAIYAADNGVVVYAGWNDWGYGNVTVLDHGNGYQTLYGHQSAIKVTCGQSVQQGDLIGLMGSTGNSSGPHLHFEMWYNSSHVDPHGFLPIAAK